MCFPNNRIRRVGENNCFLQQCLKHVHPDLFNALLKTTKQLQINPLFELAAIYSNSDTAVAGILLNTARIEFS